VFRQKRDPAHPWPPTSLEFSSSDRARKDLDDTVVRAELAGRVGRAALDVGARVRGPDDVLTSIDVTNPVYVNFRPSAQQLLAWRRNPETSRMLAPGGGARVEAVLTDGSVAPNEGRLDFIDPVLDPETGTQGFRALFRNPDRSLLPGQFVRVRLRGMTLDSVLTVPQRAVLQQMGRLLVYLVGPGTRSMPATWRPPAGAGTAGSSPGDSRPATG